MATFNNLYVSFCHNGNILLLSVVINANSKLKELIAIFLPFYYLGFLVDLSSSYCCHLLFAMRTSPKDEVQFVGQSSEIYIKKFGK
jgi:hypothetical protein